MNQFPNRDAIEGFLNDCERFVPHVERKQAPRRAALHVLAFEASTRTRISTEVAGHYLGLDVISVAGPEATSLMKNESLSDTIWTHAALDADIIAVRTPFEGGPRFVAEYLQRVPYLQEIGHHTTIINMGDGTHEHPSQCMLDLRTIKQKKGRLDNLIIGMVGDLKYGRTSHSLIRALSKFPQNRFVLVSPSEAAMPPEYLDGVEVLYAGDDLSQLATCDVVYVTRPQVERIQDAIEREIIRRWFVITPRVLNRLKPDVIVAHPLPCVNEIDPRIKLDPRFIADRQMRNGLNVRMYMELQALATFTLLSWEVPFPNPIIDSETTAADASEKKGKYFRPITGDEIGVVFDHIPVPMQNGVLDLLKYYECLEGGMKLAADPVNSEKLSSEYGGEKAVILLRKRIIPDEIVAQLSYVVPTITISLFTGDGQRRKVNKCAIPPMISYFKCGNPSCITNNDINAVPRLYTRDDGSRLQCHYCDRIFLKKQIVRFGI